MKKISTVGIIIQRHVSQPRRPSWHTMLIGLSKCQTSDSYSVVERSRRISFFLMLITKNIQREVKLHTIVPLNVTDNSHLSDRGEITTNCGTARSGKQPSVNCILLALLCPQFPTPQLHQASHWPSDTNHAVRQCLYLAYLEYHLSVLSRSPTAGEERTRSIQNVQRSIV